jgi:L-fuconolactonase
VIIDAHHHLWDPQTRQHSWLAGHPALRRRFGPAEFARLAAGQGVTASVLVQVLASTGETEEFLAVAGASDLVAGVIGWVDLTRPDVAGELLIAGLAALPNLACKLSGLVTEAGPGWTADRIAPYAARLIDSFGPQRLMFGSDWPVCTLAAGYGEVTGLARGLLAARLSAAGTEAVLAHNAARVYRLRSPR